MIYYGYKYNIHDSFINKWLRFVMYYSQKVSYFKGAKFVDK